MKVRIPVIFQLSVCLAFQFIASALDFDCAQAQITPKIDEFMVKAKYVICEYLSLDFSKEFNMAQVKSVLSLSLSLSVERRVFNRAGQETPRRLQGEGPGVPRRDSESRDGHRVLERDEEIGGEPDERRRPQTGRSTHFRHTRSRVSSGVD